MTQASTPKPSLQSLSMRYTSAFTLNGGASRDRTDDPLLAKQVLSQLSYGPPVMVGLGGLEPPASPLSGVRSNHLSYRPNRFGPLEPLHAFACQRAGALCGRLARTVDVVLKRR